MKNESNFSRLGNSNYVFKDFDYINKSAYFEYQREKIFFRKKSIIPKAKRRKFKQVSEYRVNDTVEISSPPSCRKCGSTEIAKNGRRHKVVFDLKFSSSGIKRWITQVSTSRIRCYSCGASPSALEFHNIRSKYGENLKIWIVYQLIALRQSNSRVLMQLSDLFKYDFSKTLCSKARRDISDYYQATYDQIRKRLETGQIIHADETLAVVNGIDSYVWVLASTSDVLYFYSPTRERSSVSDILEKFNGVLISDFYNVYDSFTCVQQKCLIHLIRDLNNDLVDNPFDEEYKVFVKDFGCLLAEIIKTIDQHGLQKKYLETHKDKVLIFLESLQSSKTKSLILKQYQARFRKNQNKLFTFLDYDGVPWNNNAAENAVKCFAIHRKERHGGFKESDIRRFLILLSIYQTCKYREINFLEFLRSKETDISAFKGSRKIAYLR